jgi:cell division protein FtsB
LKVGYFFLAAFLVSLGIALFGDVGLLSAYRISQDNAKLEARIERLQEENQRFNQDIEAIQTSNQHLELTIRKNLSLVAPDEIMFEFQ